MAKIDLSAGVIRTKKNGIYRMLIWRVRNASPINSPTSHAFRFISADQSANEVSITATAWAKNQTPSARRTAYCSGEQTKMPQPATVQDGNLPDNAA